MKTILTAALLSAAALSLAACAKHDDAGNAATANGVSSDSGEIAEENLTVVDDPAGNGATISNQATTGNLADPAPGNGANAL